MNSPLRTTAVSALLCALLLAGCGPAPEPSSHHGTIIALGTVVNIELITADDELADRALGELRVLFTSVGKDWYAYGDGELGHVNDALATGNAVQTSPELGALIERSLAYRDRSDGLFDPVIGNLVELWGFADFDSPSRKRTVPSDAAIDTWRNERAPRHSVSVSGRTISATGPVRIDLGGVAKGTTLVRATALLEKLGIHDAMVDAGGDLRVIGHRGRRPWRVGIRDPRSDDVLAMVDLESGESIVTSGDYERFFAAAGQRYHHILNPETGRPVENSASVTVIHANAELADAAATALMVAGPGRFDEIIGRMEISTALLIDSRGEMHMTTAMQHRLNLTPARR